MVIDEGGFMSKHDAAFLQVVQRVADCNLKVLTELNKQIDMFYESNQKIASEIKELSLEMKRLAQLDSIPADTEVH